KEADGRNVARDALRTNGRVRRVLRRIRTSRADRDVLAHAKDVTFDLRLRALVGPKKTATVITTRLVRESKRRCRRGSAVIRLHCSRNLRRHARADMTLDTSRLEIRHEGRL